MDRILDAAAQGAYQVPDLRDGEFDPNTLARQSAQAVRAALAELAETLTIRESDGTATGWRALTGDRLAELAACILGDMSQNRLTCWIDTRRGRLLCELVEPS